MAMKSALSIQANIAAGVAFQTHHVVAMFQMRKARKENQNKLPFSPCDIRPSSSNIGTKPMKIKDAMPHVGQAAVSSPPVNKANKVFRVCNP